jgi:hypothetical protein
MDENRKQIIIKEIGYWKNNKLLPEQYCNFLLALYTEGTGINETNQGSKNPKNRKKVFVWLLLIPIIVFIVYFTELSLSLQIVFAIVFILIGIYLTFYLRRSGLLFHIPLIISALLLLFVSVELTLTNFPKSTIILYSILMVNCFMWLIGGWKFKQIYFTLSGVLGLLLITISMII